MIDLNVTEAKKIRFGVAVSGVQARDLQGSLRMVIENIEYGFPISVVDDKMAVEIPALDNVVKSGILSEGQRINARLEVVAGDTFLVPWTDNFRIKRPIKVEAVVSEVEEIKEEKPKAKVQLEDIEDIKIPLLKEKKVEKTVKKEEKAKKIKSKFAKILGE